MCFREAAWVLKVSFSVLSEWNQGFDEHMRPFTLPDRRGKAAKITLEMVRIIVRVAEDLKARGRRLRIKTFTQSLREEQGIDLSRKKVQEVLVANGLFAGSTRKRRPRFYQSLRKEIPNGLLSLDGSSLTVWLDGKPYKFNVELGVDVKTSRSALSERKASSMAAGLPTSCTVPSGRRLKRRERAPGWRRRLGLPPAARTSCSPPVWS